jgi:hypothetical protein
VGYWETDTPPAAYVSLYRRIQEIGHPRTPQSLAETETQRALAADPADSGSPESKLRIQGE